MPLSQFRARGWGNRTGGRVSRMPSAVGAPAMTLDKSRVIVGISGGSGAASAFDSRNGCERLMSRRP